MRKYKNLKIIIHVLWVISFLTIILNCNQLTRMFKSTTNFNFIDAENIEVWYYDDGIFDIENDNDKRLILERLNSLELVEGEKEGFLYDEIAAHYDISEAEYHGYDWEDIKNIKKEMCEFYISIYDYEVNLTFSTEYVTVSDIWRDDCDTTNRKNYYVKNSGYNKKTKTSDLYNFIREITNNIK